MSVRSLEGRSRRKIEGEINKERYGFREDTSIFDQIFTLRKTMEKDLNLENTW